MYPNDCRAVGGYGEADTSWWTQPSTACEMYLCSRLNTKITTGCTSDITAIGRRFSLTGNKEVWLNGSEMYPNDSRAVGGYGEADTGWWTHQSTACEMYLCSRLNTKITTGCTSDIT